MPTWTQVHDSKAKHLVSEEQGGLGALKERGQLGWVAWHGMAWYGVLARYHMIG